MSDTLDEETKDAIRAMAPEKRARLREWFADEHHYRDIIAFIDSLSTEGG